MDYRREIDGLRALAVLPVILFHAGFQRFSGGFVGVDVFFVISGYLITSIIIFEQKTHTFSLIKFYERRARRILPPLFVVMAACLPFACLWLTPVQLKGFSQSLVAVSTFASNVLFWRTSGYFEAAAELKPLLHTWSLAVEEQYYLFFPILLMVTWRLGTRWILRLLALIAIVSLAAAQWGSVKLPDAAFYLLPTRGWEILMGAFIAFYSSNEKPAFKRLLNQVGGVIGFSLVLFAILKFDSHTPFPSLFTLIPTVGAGLIILFANQKTLIGRLLCSRPLVRVGLISYSAYLWHQPLFAFARSRSSEEPGTLLMSALAVSTLVLAYFSWKYVERPFRNKQFINQRQIFTCGLLGSGFFVVIGLTGHFNWGYMRLLSADERATLALQNYDYSNDYRERTCFLLPEQKYGDFSSECRRVRNGADILMLWGDSYAASLSSGLRATHENVVQYTASYCPPILDTVLAVRPNCHEINNFVLSEIKKLKPAKLLLLANWYDYKREDAIGRLAKSIELIKAASPQTKVTIVGSYPQWDPILPTVLVDSHVSLNGVQYLTMPRYAELSEVDEMLKEVSASTNIAFSSVLKIFCRADGKCMGVIKADSGYALPVWDIGHLTAAGSIMLARQLPVN
jgi:peptidoglycan/LPS O-acetylase OafA/YrhL